MACGMKDSVLISVFQVIYSIPQEQVDNLSLVFLKDSVDEMRKRKTSTGEHSFTVC